MIRPRQADSAINRVMMANTAADDGDLQSVDFVRSFKYTYTANELGIPFDDFISILKKKYANPPEELNRKQRQTVRSTYLKSLDLNKRIAAKKSK